VFKVCYYLITLSRALFLMWALLFMTIENQLNNEVNCLLNTNTNTNTKHSSVYSLCTVNTRICYSLSLHTHTLAFSTCIHWQLNHYSVCDCDCECNWDRNETDSLKFIIFIYVFGFRVSGFGNKVVNSFVCISWMWTTDIVFEASSNCATMAGYNIAACGMPHGFTFLPSPSVSLTNYLCLSSGNVSCKIVMRFARKQCRKERYTERNGQCNNKVCTQ